MSKYYRRGHSIKIYFTGADYLWSKVDPSTLFKGTEASANRAQLWGSDTEFAETMIIRGIGYRAFALRNDLLFSETVVTEIFENTLRPLYLNHVENQVLDLVQAANFEFTTSKYLVIRAGHTRDLSIPLRGNTRAKTIKKDRKLTILDKSNVVASNTAKRV